MGGGIELDRVHPIFEGIVPVHIIESNGKDASMIHEIREVVIRILNGHSSFDNQDILHMELTSTEKPMMTATTADLSSFFLYTLQVSQQEFHNLKTDQSLLVDFKSFPSKFVELLSCCGLTCNKENDNTSSVKFKALLEQQEHQQGVKIFRIAELNKFKELTHLSLKFQKGTDERIKSYLSTRLQHSLRIHEETKSNLSAKEATLLEYKKKLEELQQEHNDLQQQYKDQSIRHNNEIDKLLTKQKQESVKLLEQTQLACTEQALKQQDQSNDRIQQLQEELEYQLQQNKELQTLKIKQSELESKIEALQESEGKYQVETKHLRQTNHELEQQIFEYEKETTKQKMTIESLQQQIKDKEALIMQNEVLMESSKERKSAAEEKLILYRKSTEKLQRKLELSIAEINKGNEIIQRHQENSKQYKHKIKMKNTVIKQQEKLIQQQKQTIEKGEQRIYTLTTTFNTEKSNNQQLKQALEASQNKVQECNKMIESNQNVISYLNKEINQNQMITTTDTNPNYNRRSPLTVQNDQQHGEFEQHLISQGFESFPEPEAFNVTDDVVKV